LTYVVFAANKLLDLARLFAAIYKCTKVGAKYLHVTGNQML